MVSVVAGCSLFDGVLLAADCRVTIIRGETRVYSDTVQKVFDVRPHTSIGFVGDVGAAAFMLYHLLIQANRRRESGPTDLLRWMPRFFRRAYSDYNPSKRKKESVIFIAAGAEIGKENVVKRKVVVDLVEDIGFQRTVIKRQWMPAFLLEFLKIDPRCEYVSLPGTSRGLLYVMRAPNFEPEHYGPLQFVAIGSGERVVEEVHAYRDAVLAMHPGHSGIEGGQFRDAIRHFIDRNNIESVGGLYPVIKMSTKGAEAVGDGLRTPDGEINISLVHDGKRWIQRNAVTGKEIALLFPWEFKPDNVRKDVRFDDLKEAFKKIRGE
jgi:hypothetical protein